MNDIQYEILDALYFVVAFDVLKKHVKVDEHTLVDELLELIQRGWVYYLEHPDGEHNPESVDFRKAYPKLFFLASKKGLFAHNSV